mmetsp:Transcript_546/g.1930  ORF Transcript_546/g.1930 Transcript_546/m.1930 type:complete len:218 (-) Transcript_546:426-1079(-)
MAELTAATIASTSGGAKVIISGGKTSGTPPTAVLTTLSPQDAASSRAMQNASVREQFRKTSACTSTDRTSLGATAPSMVTRPSSPCADRICSSTPRLGPSPPTSQRTAGNLAHISGMTSTSRSMPFLYTRRLTTAMVTTPGVRWEGSGVNTAVSTALGMTNTRSGSNPARSTVFSLLVWETQMTAWMSHRVNLRSLFVWTLLESWKPKREWSVKTQG